MDEFEDHCWRDVMPADAYDIYASYRRETGIVGKPGLVAIDLFNGVFPSEPAPVVEAMKSQPRSCGVFGYNAMAPIQDLLGSFRRHRLPIFFTTSAALDSTRSRRATHRRSAYRPEDFAIHPAFARRDEEPLVRKERASGFFNTELKRLLDEAGVETVVLCGESTSGCVRATAVDAYSHGYHVVVSEESVFDRSILSHKVTLFDLHHKYADVIGNDLIIESVGEDR